MNKKNEGNLAEIDYEKTENINPSARFREYTGPIAKVIFIMSVIWVLFQLYESIFGGMILIKSRAMFFGFLCILIFLLLPAIKKEKQQRKMPSFFDLLCILATIASIGYLLLTYDDFTAVRLGQHVPLDIW